MDKDRKTFSTGDYKLFRFTAVLGSLVACASLIILIFWILSRVLSHFSTLLLPLAIAGVMALVLEPVVRFLKRRLHTSRLAAIIVIGVVLLILMAGVYLLVLPEAAEQASEIKDTAPELIASARESIAVRFPQLVEAVEREVDDIDLKEQSFDFGGMVEHVSHYASMLVGLGFVPLYLFFMLLAGSSIPRNARELISVLSSEKQEEIIFLVSKFIGYITAFFQGQLVIAMIVGVLLATGFTVVGLQAAILLGLLLGLLNIVPFLGTVVGLVLTLPIAWVQPDGGLQLVGLVLLVFIVVQLVESWVLTPRIMSERSGLHPAIVVISLFFWGIVFGGLIGMILAVPLSAFLVALWRHVKTNYLNQVLLDSGTIEVDHAVVDSPDHGNDDNSV